MTIEAPINVFNFADKFDENVEVIEAFAQLCFDQTVQMVTSWIGAQIIQNKELKGVIACIAISTIYPLLEESKTINKTSILDILRQTHEYLEKSL